MTDTNFVIEDFLIFKDVDIETGEECHKMCGSSTVPEYVFINAEGYYVDNTTKLELTVQNGHNYINNDYSCPSNKGVLYCVWRNGDEITDKVLEALENHPESLLAKEVDKCLELFDHKLAPIIMYETSKADGCFVRTGGVDFEIVDNNLGD